MLILSNALSQNTDEGCIKVASSLVKRIKNDHPSVTVVSYERQSPFADEHLSLNKLLISKKLFRILRKHRGNVLYIPFPAKTIATAIRVFVLSLMQKGRLDVMLVMKSQMNPMAKALVKLSGSNIIVLSKDAYDFYADFIDKSKITYLKTGVDTDKFVPVNDEQKALLKQKYGIGANKKVVLHVGHLKEGRNIAQLAKIDEKYQVLLVASTLTKDQQDANLKSSLQNCKNIKIIDKFIPNIEEIYQLCDAYIFPTTLACNCIDVPLSCLEAAACNKPIITTPFGEMAQFKGNDGFYFTESFDKEQINALIEKATTNNSPTRQAVLPYHWQEAVEYFIKDLL